MFFMLLKVPYTPLTLPPMGVLGLKTHEPPRGVKPKGGVQAEKSEIFHMGVMAIENLPFVTPPLLPYPLWGFWV